MFDPIKEQQKMFETWNENLKKMMTPNIETMQNMMFPNIEVMKSICDDAQKNSEILYGNMQEKAKEMYTEMQDNFKKACESIPGYKEYMEKFGAMFTPMADYSKLFELKAPGFEMYNQLYDFYKGAMNPEDFIKNQQENYTKIMNTFIKNSINDESVADLLKQPKELMETCLKFYQNMMQPWMQIDNKIIERALKGDVDAYIEFFTEVSEKYEKTFGKVVKMMNMGINLEVADEQQKAMDAYYKFLFSAGKLVAIMSKNSTDSANALVDNYKTLIEKGQKITTFREFYDLWYNTNEKAMESLFATERFSKAFADFSDKYFLYMAASNAVLERNLSKLPIPTNKDMNSLYRTVYELRKEVRDLRKANESMQKAIDELKSKPATKPAKEAKEPKSAKNAKEAKADKEPKTTTKTTAETSKKSETSTEKKDK